MTNHEHSNNCGCHNHKTEHSSNHEQGCSSCSHEHEHGEDCSCHSHDTGDIVYDTNLSNDQLEFLKELAKCHHLPVTQFVVKSEKEAHFTSVALVTVYLNSPTDTMQTVRHTGIFLEKLESQGMITLDYDVPIKGYSYDEYYNCDLYKFFCQTVEEGKGKSGFLGDTPYLEKGSMALTEVAIALLQD